MTTAMYDCVQKSVVNEIFVVEYSESKFEQVCHSLKAFNINKKSNIMSNLRN